MGSYSRTPKNSFIGGLRTYNKMAPIRAHQRRDHFSISQSFQTRHVRQREKLDLKHQARLTLRLARPKRRGRQAYLLDYLQRSKQFNSGKARARSVVPKGLRSRRRKYFR